ncbi:tetracycline resistance [Fusarium pseudocircinatum]|uniref:Tetracycline resistance n=1 Tax=Fusarium pseudocircinatum TaxID=56676 RepID=A0A8H5NVT4_9HYPO|nr:tetracycline resistance [Fusarium pseudocircinatum]
MCNSGTGISLPIVPHMGHLVAQKELAAATARASPSRGTVHQVKTFTPEALLFALHHFSNFQLLTFDILHLTYFHFAIFSEIFCQDSSSALANGISLMVFHLFPNLPTELRLKIWKSACFPYATNQRGIHYIDLASIGDDLRSWIGLPTKAPMEMKALHHDFSTSHSGQRVVGRANRSAYMWDAGLWKACKESREIISTPFQLKLWRSTQNSDLEPLELDECLSKACQPYPSQLYSEEPASEDDEELYEKRPGDEDSVLEPEPFLPTCLPSSNQEHADRFMVMPIRDLFCIQTPPPTLLQSCLGV